MKVYITYDHDPSIGGYTIYHIDTDKTAAITHFKQMDLPAFLEGGPDDSHSFQLEEVDMTPEKYKKIMSFNPLSLDYQTFPAELKEFMDALYSELGTTILFSDGISDNIEIGELYMQKEHPDLDEDSDEYDKTLQAFYNDPELFKKYMTLHIGKEYRS